MDVVYFETKQSITEIDYILTPIKITKCYLIQRVEV